MNKRKRKEIIKRRKNFFPTLVITILLWISILLIVFFMDPFTPGVLPLLFFLLFLSLIFSLSIIFEDSKRGLIFSLAIIFFLILRFMGLGNPINFLLILGVAISLDKYL